MSDTSDVVSPHEHQAPDVLDSAGADVSAGDGDMSLEAMVVAEEGAGRGDLPPFSVPEEIRALHG